MRKIHFICLLFFMFASGFSSLWGQTDAAKMKSFVLNDTTFLFREYGSCGWHRIYVEKNRKAYKWFKKFHFDDEYDKPAYEAYMGMLRKEISGGLKAFDLDSLPRRWIPLYLHENRYYVYLNHGNTGKQLIDEYTIMVWTMDGPMPSAIRSVEKTENCYAIDFYTPKAYGGSGSGQVQRLNIYIVEPTYKIAVWEYIYPDSEKAYSLYLPAESVDYFRAIISVAETCKTHDLHFEEPNYKNLISNIIKPAN